MRNFSGYSAKDCLRSTMSLMLHSYLRSRSRREWMWRSALYGWQEYQAIALRNRNDTYNVLEQCAHWRVGSL